MDLEKEKGELINYSLARQLTGDGILDDNKQEDNEEAVLWYSDDVTLRQFRNAVRLQGKLSEKRTAFDQGELAKDLLRDWMAGFLDNRMFVTIMTSPTRTVYGGDATSTATIESGDFLTLPMLTQAKTAARKATPQIRPPKTKEGEYFVAVLAPDVMYDLKTRDPGYNEAHKEAMQRGPTNPIFTGAEAIYDGVILRSCTRVPLTTDWGTGANLNGAENPFLGLRAGVLAIGRKPDMVIQAFDYENKIGFAIRIIA
jgi:N4-gp56 family major capsid protein